MDSVKSIRTLVIDDEISAILLLEGMIEKMEGVVVAGHAQSVEEGVNLVLLHRPDIIFLDIRIKEENGFNLIYRLKYYDVNPYIVMVTGFDQYGIDAIKAGAFDYLLKPVDPAELLKVISRYRHKQAHQPIPGLIKKIRFNTLGGFVLINPDEILYCKAEANYTDIFLTNQHKHTISLNIGNIEKVLTGTKFFRTNRSVIINTEYLIGINRGKRQCFLSVNQSSISLPVAHDRMRELEEMLVQ
jgi:two-component system LytT family response regulator